MSKKKPKSHPFEVPREADIRKSIPHAPIEENSDSHYLALDTNTWIYLVGYSALFKAKNHSNSDSGPELAFFMPYFLVSAQGDIATNAIGKNFGKPRFVHK